MEFGIGIKLIDKIIDVVTIMLERVASRYAAHGSHLECIARSIALAAAHFHKVQPQSRITSQGKLDMKEH